MKETKLSESDVKKLKELVLILKLAKVDALTLRAILGGDAPLLDEKVKEAERILWSNGKEDEEVKRLKEALQKEVVKEKTISGKYDVLKKVLKTGIALALVGAAIVGVSHVSSLQGGNNESGTEIK